MGETISNGIQLRRDCTLSVPWSWLSGFEHCVSIVLVRAVTSFGCLSPLPILLLSNAGADNWREGTCVADVPFLKCTPFMYIWSAYSWWRLDIGSYMPDLFSRDVCPEIITSLFWGALLIASTIRWKIVQTRTRANIQVVYLGSSFILVERHLWDVNTGNSYVPSAKIDSRTGNTLLEPLLRVITWKYDISSFCSQFLSME